MRTKLNIYVFISAGILPSIGHVNFHLVFALCVGIILFLVNYAYALISLTI